MKAKRDASDLVTCVDAFSVGDTIVRDGEIYLRTDEVVKLRPDVFVPFLATTAERREARQRINEAIYG
jgi:hypothetical protein